MDPHSTVSTVGGLKRFTPIYEPGANLHSVLKSPFRAAETYGPPRQLPPHNLSPLNGLATEREHPPAPTLSLNWCRGRSSKRCDLNSAHRAQCCSYSTVATLSPSDNILYCMI